MQINEKGFSEKSDNTLTLLMDGFTESPENARLLVISGDRHKRYCVTIMTLADGKMASLTASSMYALAYELNDKWGFSMDFDQTCDFELVGQYCMGSTELNVDGVATAMPVVYATEADAQAEIDAMQMGYQEDIDAGERDEDDEYEGEVMIMQWDGGDKVIIKALDMSVIDDTNTWQFHAGL